MATFSVHFDGPITNNHRLPLRVMARTYTHMQRAVDRAYLLEERGSIRKNARLRDDEYEETELFAERTRDGGVIMDAVRDGIELAFDDVIAAIRPVFERATARGLEQAQALQEQLLERREYAAGMGRNTQTFEALMDEPPRNWERAYSQRSIVKEIDQIVGQVTPERLDGSTVDIQLLGTEWSPRWDFNRDIAQRFHIAASFRELAAPVLVRVQLRSLDLGNRYQRPKGKALNLATGREVTLHLSNQEDFAALHPHHAANRDVLIFASPMLEAGGFDLHGGDLQFVSVA